MKRAGPWSWLGKEGVVVLAVSQLLQQHWGKELSLPSPGAEHPRTSGVCCRARVKGQDSVFHLCSCSVLAALFQFFFPSRCSTVSDFLSKGNHTTKAFSLSCLATFISWSLLLTLSLAAALTIPVTAEAEAEQFWAGPGAEQAPENRSCPYLSTRGSVLNPSPPEAELLLSPALMCSYCCKCSSSTSLHSWEVQNQRPNLQQAPGGSAQLLSLLVLG